MVAGRRNWTKNRVADIDDKHCARLTAENIEIRDVKTNVLPGDGRIQMMGHASPSCGTEGVASGRRELFCSSPDGRREDAASNQMVLSGAQLKVGAARRHPRSRTNTVLK
jgi:hypothetical protein